MKFGLSLPVQRSPEEPKAQRICELIEQVTTARGLGFDNIFASQHSEAMVAPSTPITMITGPEARPRAPPPFASGGLASTPRKETPAEHCGQSLSTGR